MLMCTIGRPSPTNMSIKQPLLYGLRVATLAPLLLLGAASARAELVAIMRTPDGSSIRLLDVRADCKGKLMSAMMVLQPEGKTIEGCWMFNKDTSRYFIQWQGAPGPRAYAAEEFEMQRKSLRPQ